MIYLSRRLLATLALSSVLLSSGCQYSTGTVSQAPVAYLSLIGHDKNQSVVIDAGSPVLMAADANEPNRIQVEPGRHRVRVLGPAGNVVFEKEVMVSDEQTLEIRVP